MLQQSEIKQRLSGIEREIEEVARDCESSETIPQKLKDCVSQWKQHTVKAKTVFDSQDNKQIIGCVNDLEQIGHRAEMALQEAKGVDARVRNTLLHAQSELVDLKKKLH